MKTIQELLKIFWLMIENWTQQRRLWISEILDVKPNRYKSGDIDVENINKVLIDSCPFITAIFSYDKYILSDQRGGSNVDISRSCDYSDMRPIAWILRNLWNTEIIGCRRMSLAEAPGFLSTSALSSSSGLSGRHVNLVLSRWARYILGFLELNPHSLSELRRRSKMKEYQSRPWFCFR